MGSQSGRRRILVARLDAIEIELCVSRGPVWTTRVSSARVCRDAMLSGVARGRNTGCSNSGRRPLGRKASDVP